MRLIVARIGRAHGLHGEVTVEVRTDEPDRRFVIGTDLYPVAGSGSGSPGAPEVLSLSSVRDHRGRFLLGFVGVEDRDAAEALRGLVIEAEVPEESEDDDAWYDHQLVGLEVHDPRGERLGRVVRVDHPPAQDLLVVRVDGRDDLRMVPFVTALVPEVDLSAGRVVVDDPGGLLSDPAPGTDGIGAGSP